ncbi:hypothetical protein Y032_0133g1792 [Ancylostoma ceylanicum]|uniref:Uncharacterized protein n=1 Tax=Ancylostoma ceylanicum TaxID=53326 RepID=A0A016T6H3_9BILA|nr:hypothetical protein Y032_0133g1792 [Ancylostoma ceylanicum]
MSTSMRKGLSSAVSAKRMLTDVDEHAERLVWKQSDGNDVHEQQRTDSSRCLKALPSLMYTSGIWILREQNKNAANTIEHDEKVTVRFTPKVEVFRSLPSETAYAMDRFLHEVLL